jgi:hypothetical protein
MSQDLQKLATISYVTDCDTELYVCGEMTGGFDEEELKKYLERYEKTGLEDILLQLSFMTHHAIMAWRKIQDDKNIGATCEQPTN